MPLRRHSSNGGERRRVMAIVHKHIGAVYFKEICATRIVHAAAELLSGSYNLRAFQAKCAGSRNREHQVVDLELRGSTDGEGNIGHVTQNGELITACLHNLPMRNKVRGAAL